MGPIESSPDQTLLSKQIRTDQVQKQRNLTFNITFNRLTLCQSKMFCYPANMNQLSYVHEAVRLSNNTSFDRCLQRRFSQSALRSITGVNWLTARPIELQR
jgi:hypothetical protein